MRVERALKSAVNASTRKVTFPGGQVRHTNADPKEIARLIGMESKLAKSEGKLAAVGKNGRR